MKIDRRGFLAASSSALVMAKTQLAPAEPIKASEPSAPLSIAERIAGREVAVYTTADNSDYRLAATDSVTFKPMGQPLETQICVFVDPAKRFQTMLGIGGALTDAAAETFANCDLLVSTLGEREASEQAETRAKNDVATI